MFTLPSLLSARSRPTPSSTPLDLPHLVGATGWSRLPTDVQRRFGATHADTTYTGHMDLRCSRIGRIYAGLACLFGRPLPHVNTHAVPTTVQVSRNARGGVVWARCFHGRQPHLVRSTKETDSNGRLLERTAGGLSMALDVFEDHGSLVFRSRRFWLMLGPLRMAIPTWLTPGVCCVTHTDLGHGLFRFTMTMTHPLWGETFHQSGIFTDPFGSEP